MAVADPDLDGFRHDFAGEVGCAVSDVGMLPDEAHKKGGGYHCGLTDLAKIGKFHQPRTSFAGSANEDYSVRQARDRLGADDRSAAVDTPGSDVWRKVRPDGRQAAFLRMNKLVVAQMQKGDPALSALRAVNFTPDGVTKKRFDSLHPDAGVAADGIIPSTDTVLWHTHWEFWRDTLGTAALRRTLRRILQIVRAAVAGRPVPPEQEEDDDMGASFGPIEIRVYDPEHPDVSVTSLSIPPVEAGAADPRPAWFNVTNDTNGATYALRVIFGDGKGGWLGERRFTLGSGWRQAFDIPKGVAVVSVGRLALDDSGKPVDPWSKAAKVPPYPGHLTCCIERGALIR